MTMNRNGLVGDRSAFGAIVDYPNDLWDIALVYKRIGDGFDPSLGFVPRPGVQIITPFFQFKPRPSWSWLRLWRFELFSTLVTDLDGRRESYRVFTAPINWLFESGERFEFNVVPEGERIVAPFEISDGVFIPAGSYNWIRYRLEADLAAKRVISGRVSWWFGEFYGGTLSQLQTRALWKPSATFTTEVSAEHNVGNLPGGRFVQDLIGTRVRVNISPDLQVNAFVQYDNESRSVGSNMRLRWTFDPLGDLFLVYNHNVRDLNDRWRLDSNQFLAKVQYAIRR